MTDVVATDLPEPVNARVRSLALPRTLSVGAVAGAICGLLVGGVLGRLAMRLLAVTSGQSAQGGVTDDQAIVGEATLRGTVTLALINCSAAPSAAHCSSMSTDHSTTQCSPQPG
jgi:hypothetical protein